MNSASGALTLQTVKKSSRAFNCAITLLVATALGLTIASTIYIGTNSKNNFVSTTTQPVQQTSSSTTVTSTTTTTTTTTTSSTTTSTTTSTSSTTSTTSSTITTTTITTTTISSTTITSATTTTTLTDSTTATIAAIATTSTIVGVDYNDVVKYMTNSNSANCVAYIAGNNCNNFANYACAATCGDGFKRDKTKDDDNVLASLFEFNPLYAGGPQQCALLKDQGCETAATFYALTKPKKVWYKFACPVTCPYAQDKEDLLTLNIAGSCKDIECSDPIYKYACAETCHTYLDYNADIDSNTVLEEIIGVLESSETDVLTDASKECGAIGCDVYDKQFLQHGFDGFHNNILVREKLRYQSKVFASLACPVTCPLDNPLVDYPAMMNCYDELCTSDMYAPFCAKTCAEAEIMQYPPISITKDNDNLLSKWSGDTCSNIDCSSGASIFCPASCLDCKCISVCTAESDGLSYCEVDNINCRGIDNQPPQVLLSGTAGVYGSVSDEINIDCTEEGGKCRAMCEGVVGRYDCWSYPCNNGGLCIDGDNTYFCLCPDGYADVNCLGQFDLVKGEQVKSCCNPLPTTTTKTTTQT